MHAGMLERARKYMGMPASPGRPLLGIPDSNGNGTTPPGLPSSSMRTPPTMGAPLGPRPTGAPPPITTPSILASTLLTAESPVRVLMWSCR